MGVLVLLQNKIHSVAEEVGSAIVGCTTLAELESVRVRYLGKSGVLTLLLKQIAGVTDLTERKTIGALANSVNREVRAAFQEKESALEREMLKKRLFEERVDITLPSREKRMGVLHPVTKVLAEMKKILGKMGFTEISGPDLEDEFHVFDALNTPLYHPAREKNDTFYLREKLGEKRVVLRTHTSSVQIRAMESNSTFPIKIISSGKVYRNDWDATHSPMFHQVEGLYIDTHVNMGHLKYCINSFLQKFFDNEVTMRMRASFFPFTEPSAEVDIKDSSGKWVEVLGCGMVHYKVLENVNIDPEKYSGFAFGMGVERMAMLKYNIADLRNLYNNRLEWLEHYGFCFTDLVE